MSKPFLIIQLRPEDATADNELEAIKHYGTLEDSEIVRLRAEQAGPKDIELSRYAGIIVGGSPFDISTPADQKSATQLEIEAGFSDIFDTVIAQDFPFLGCCSGNGLLGNYIGASISQKYAGAVGGATIALSEERKRDPLLRGFPDTFRVLLGHKEACDDTPPGAVLLASNTARPVQMFRVKNNIYATQFHPEADASGFTVHINIYKDYGYFPADSAKKLIAAIEKEELPEAQLLLKRFVETYRT